jgi:hypothetical protein
MPAAEILWRVFPWDSVAPDGAPYSPQFMPSAGYQGSGRFDIGDGATAVTYFAESPDHAVAEMIQNFRNNSLDQEDLTRYGKPLALVSVTLSPAMRDRIVDLCDPTELVNHEVQPDRVAARSRTTSQVISSRLHTGGYAGLRWWSAFFGEWHTVVVFRDVVIGGELQFGTPEILELDHPAVIEAASAIDVTIPSKKSV